MFNRLFRKENMLENLRLALEVLMGEGVQLGQIKLVSAFSLRKIVACIGGKEKQIFVRFCGPNIFRFTIDDVEYLALAGGSSMVVIKNSFEDGGLKWVGTSATDRCEKSLSQNYA
jgi:hypothetical protein